MFSFAFIFDSLTLLQPASKVIVNDKVKKVNTDFENFFKFNILNLNIIKQKKVKKISNVRNNLKSPLK